VIGWRLILSCKKHRSGRMQNVFGTELISTTRTQILSAHKTNLWLDMIYNHSITLHVSLTYFLKIHFNIIRPFSNFLKQTLSMPFLTTIISNMSVLTQAYEYMRTYGLHVCTHLRAWTLVRIHTHTHTST
jgi:hypothetical protein